MTQHDISMKTKIIKIKSNSSVQVKRTFEGKHGNTSTTTKEEIEKNFRFILYRLYTSADLEYKAWSDTQFRSIPHREL